MGRGSEPSLRKKELMMQAVEFIEYKGARILRMEFSGSGDSADAAAIKGVMEEAKRIIAQQPPHSLLALTVISAQASFNAEIAVAFREFVLHNKPFIKIAALVGIYGMRRALLNSLSIISHRGSSLKICQDEEEAKEFLAAFNQRAMEEAKGGQ